jgi:uroporphyrinogen-III decarboxylase
MVKAVSGQVAILGWIDMPLAVDHLVSLSAVRDVYAAHGKCFKGNLNPVAHMMQASPDQCRQLAHECLSVARWANCDSIVRRAR